jgi:hypothetical protein
VPARQTIEEGAQAFHLGKRNAEACCVWLPGPRAPRAKRDCAEHPRVVRVARRRRISAMVAERVRSRIEAAEALHLPLRAVPSELNASGRSIEFPA